MPNLESSREQIETLRQEISGDQKTVRKTLEEKIDQVDSKFSTKFDQVDGKFSAKFDQVFSALSKTNVDVARLVGDMKSLRWVVGGTVSVAGLLEIVLRLGDKFHWF